MHFKWLRKLRSRTPDGGDAKDPATQSTAPAATREADPETQALRSHYRETFECQSHQVLRDFKDRLNTSGHRNNHKLILWYEEAIRECCTTVSFCLLEEWLVRRQPSPSPTSPDEYWHVDRARHRLCEQLIHIGNLAAHHRDFQRPGQSLAKSFVALAVAATTRAALEATTTLDFESSTMAVSHSLLATAQQTAEYVARCHVHGQKPLRDEATALLASSSDICGPDVPGEIQASSGLASSSTTLLGSPETVPESTSSRYSFDERPETPSSYSSSVRSSYSAGSATAGCRADEYISLIGSPQW
ncbi:hypothetical protein PG985_000024 [Apiospora marii]|uniref:DUF4145 domain-containing protein n=1 Tax=Apiospora marii TaxID=335849 RepID=A0ABR1QZT1_9PEZI